MTDTRRETASVEPKRFLIPLSVKHGAYSRDYSSRLGAEDWRGGRQTTADKIRAALETAGIEFIGENGDGPGVRLRKRQRSKEPK